MMQPIKECLQLGITAEQYMAWKLIELNSTGERAYSHEFVQTYGEPSPEVIEVLVSKDLVYAPFKSSGPYTYSDVITRKTDKGVLLELAEELWDSYPATFPLSTGGMFVARTGAKEVWLVRYMEKIRWSPEKHKEVMHQLGRYVAAVSSGKINGCKVVDWIEAEMWNTMKDIADSDVHSSFKEDI